MSMRRWLGLVGLGASLGLAVPGSAGAVEYEIFVDIDDEEDLNELQLTEQIDDTTYEALVELLRRGIDLNDASRETLYALPNLSYDEVDRIIAYREDAGRIADPADLVVAGVLSERKLAALAAFLLVPNAEGSRRAINGRVRYRMTYVPGDDGVPPMVLQAQVSALGNLTVGGAALVDPRLIGQAQWDPNRGALVAERAGPRPRLPKLFAQWDTDRWGVIAGSYRIGFGQRLTFDNTRRYTPNGYTFDNVLVARYDLTGGCRESAGELAVSPCEDDDRRVAPSYRFATGLRGVAAGAKKLPLPVGWLQAYGFFSLQNHDIYQYHIYNRDGCEDPRSDDAQCSSTDLFVKLDDPLAPTSRHVFRTIPNVVDLITQGANLGWYHNSRTHVGVTGYGTIPRWRVEGADLDFRAPHRFPRGGSFGAVGADFSWGYRWADIFGEVSRSFDGIPKDQNGGGGFAALVRHTATWDDHEIELSGRYYDRDFANPYGRPISARDRFEGNQARDEAGGRLRYNARLVDRVSLRTFADFWVRPSNGEPRTRVYARTDVDVNRWWRPGLWLEYQNNDLGRPRFSQCVDQDIVDESSGSVFGLPEDAITCGGQRVQLTARSRFEPIRKKLWFTVQYRHEWQNSLFIDNSFSRTADFGDAIDYDLFDIFDEGDLERLLANNGLRQDVNAFLAVNARPVDPLRLRARVRWFWEDIADNGRLENSVWAYLDVQYRIRTWAIPSIRYDIFAYVDRRDSTADRQPNPEHWVRLQFESRF